VEARRGWLLAVALTAFTTAVVVHAEPPAQYNRDRGLFLVACAVFLALVAWFFFDPLFQRVVDRHHGKRKPLARHRQLDDGDVELTLLPRDELVGDAAVDVWSRSSPRYRRFMSDRRTINFPHGFSARYHSAPPGRYHFRFVKLTREGGVMREQGELARGRFRYRPKAQQHDQSQDQNGHQP
jgi:hypothetical protein